MLSSLSRFYERSFFERLVLYIFASHLVVKVVFEFGMGAWHFHLSREQQYVFYSLLLADYAITWRRFATLSISSNHLAYVAIFFLILTVYGVVTGIVNANDTFAIFNDTVPLVVIALNILRIQAERERIEAETVYRLMRDTAILGVAICLVGFVSLSIGNPSRASLNAMPLAVFIALYSALLISGQRLSPWFSAAFIVVLGFSMGDLNRSTMLLLVAVLGSWLIVQFCRYPRKALVSLFALLVVASVAWLVVLPDTKAGNRIQALGSFMEQAASRKTAVGERVVEYQSILQRLARDGRTVEIFGLGHGALYDMRGANRYKTDYGHAHFSWALFKLRYGDLGYVFTAVLAVFVLANFFFHLGSLDPVSLFVSVISASAFIYMFTYVTFIFLLAGVSFLARAPQTGTSGGLSCRSVNYVFR